MTREQKFIIQLTRALGRGVEMWVLPFLSTCPVTHWQASLRLSPGTKWTLGQKGKWILSSKEVCRATSGTDIAFPEPPSTTEQCSSPRAQHLSTNLEPHAPSHREYHIVYCTAISTHDAVPLQSNAWRTLFFITAALTMQLQSII